MLPRVPFRLAIPGLLILAGFFNGSCTLRADVIYTNFGSGDAYASGTGLIVTNDGQAYSSVAIGFTPAANYYLNSIEFVATDLIANDSADITIGIFADNGGQPGGSPVESFSVGGLGAFGDSVSVLSVTSLLRPLLLANMTYWIGMNAAAGDFIVWNQNSTGALGFLQTDGTGNWSASGADQGVVQIDGTLVPASETGLNLDSTGDSAPEPRAWWLIAGGLAAMALRPNRRLLAVKTGARFPDQKQRARHERGHRPFRRHL